MKYHLKIYNPITDKVYILPEERMHEFANNSGAITKETLDSIAATCVEHKPNQNKEKRSLKVQQYDPQAVNAGIVLDYLVIQNKSETIRVNHDFYSKTAVLTQSSKEQYRKEYSFYTDFYNNNYPFETVINLSKDYFKNFSKKSYQAILSFRKMFSKSNKKPGQELNVVKSKITLPDGFAIEIPNT